MNGFVEYLLKVIAILFKIGLVLFVIGVIAYFSLSRYIDYRMKQVQEKEAIEREQQAKEREQYEKESADKPSQEELDKEAAYSRCVNSAYKEYKKKYDEECSKIIMDGECVVSQEKRYELDGIYMHDKADCEKLKQ